MKEDKGKIQLFEFNDQIEEFKELEVRENTLLYEYLDPNLITLIVTSQNSTGWLWCGRKTSWRIIEIAKDMVGYVKDKYLINFNVRIVSQDHEPLALKEMLGLSFEDDLKYPDYDMMPEILDRGFKKIDSLMKERSVNELEIERKYLPEIFSEDILSFSYNFSIILKEFRKRGIICEINKDKIKFFRVIEYLKKRLNKKINYSQMLYGKLPSDDLRNFLILQFREKEIKKMLRSSFAYPIEQNFLKEELNRIQQLIKKESERKKQKEKIIEKKLKKALYNKLKMIKDKKKK